jgi:FkbM family methyltransferase
MNFFKSIAILLFTLLDKYVHQKRVIKYIKNNIDVKLFIDVGAHKGTYSDLILKNYKNCKVHMFEPQKNIYNYIKKKYKKKKNITIYNNALSDTKSIKVLNINNHDLTSSLLELNKNNKYLKLKAKLFGTNLKGMISKLQKVKTVELGKILEKKLFKNGVDLVKIDTEGHELKVLKGLRKNIKKIDYVMIEFHRGKTFKNYNPNLIHNYLVKNKFLLKKIYKFPFTNWEDRFYRKQ